MPYATDKQVRLPLDPEQHQQIRELAAREGVPMSVVARRVISRFLASQPVSRPTENPRRERSPK
jgi:hypothetical protein